MIKNSLGDSIKVREMLGWADKYSYQIIREFVERKILPYNNDVETIGKHIVEFIDEYYESIDPNALDEYLSCCGNCSGNPCLKAPNFKCSHDNCKPWNVCSDWEKGITTDVD